MTRIEEDNDRIVLASKNHEVMRNMMVKASEEYLGGMATEKELWGEYEYSKKYGIDDLKDLEESRMQFVKRSIEKFSSLCQKEQYFISESLESLKSSCSHIIPSKENLTIKENFFSNEDIKMQNWVTYEEWKKILKSEGINPMSLEENFISSEVNYKPMNSDVAAMKTLIFSMIPDVRKHSSESSSTDKSTLMETPSLGPVEHDSVIDFSKRLINPSSWDVFLTILESRRHFGYVEPENLASLAGLLSTIISLMMDEKNFRIEVFYKIVVFSHNFYTLDGKRTYLSKFLSSHPIFSVQKYWNKVAYYAIISKLNTEKILFKKTQQRLKKQGKKPQKPNKNSSKSTTGNILSQYNFYMMNLKAPTEVAEMVIKECAAKQKIGSDRLFPLISELHSIQSTPPTFQSINILTRYNSKIRSKWGIHMHLGLALEFLAIQEIPTLLYVCKAWHNLLLGNFYKQALLKHRKINFRTKAWTSVLYKPGKKKYSVICEEFKNKPGAIKELEDVIHMDVLRSYANNSSINMLQLESILKAYAFYRPKVGYCQGMHYLAGTLSQILKNEERTFWCLDELIRVHHMQELYGNDMAKLRVFFYVLDRLISLFLPELRTTLNYENIVSSTYSSTWFVTLFAGQLSSKPEVLLRIWDYFIYVNFI